MRNKQEMLKKRDELQQYVSRGITRINSGNLNGSHLLGVATKAVSSFETLMCGLLSWYMLLCDVDYNESLRPLVKGKDLNRLTLGEIILGFRTFNSRFTKCTASQLDKSIPLRKKLVDGKLSNNFDRITTIRKRLHQDEPMPETEARELLSLISISLEQPLFEIVESQS